MRHEATTYAGNTKLHQSIETHATWHQSKRIKYLHPTVLISRNNWLKQQHRRLFDSLCRLKQLRRRKTEGERENMAITALYLTIVPHALAVAAAVMVLVWCIHFRGGLAWDSSNKNHIFNLHPVLMLIGFIILGGQAIMSYKSLPLSKDVKKLMHLVLHAIALILGIIGIYTAFKYHNESSIVNLYSLHSWLGMGIIVLYGIQWIYGFLVFFYPEGSAGLRSESLPWHVLLGLFVYILAVGNASLGFLEKLTFLENSGLARHGAEAYLVNFTAVVTILYGAFVIFTVLNQNFYRVRSWN